MGKELKEELALGEKLANELAEHLRRMGAASTEFECGDTLVTVAVIISNDNKGRAVDDASSKVLRDKVNSKSVKTKAGSALSQSRRTK